MAYRHTRAAARLRENPLSAISKPSFLEILEKTRNEVYTVNCIASAWRKAHCWPINRSNKPGVSDNVSAKDCASSSSTTNTPNRLRALT